VKIWRTNGGGFTGTGCVGEAASPSRSEAGTGRSSTGKSGFPVSRSNRKTKPVFVTCATPSTRRPFCCTVTSTGGQGRS
jgi:hypothetical protein